MSNAQKYYRILQSFLTSVKAIAHHVQMEEKFCNMDQVYAYQTVL